PAGGRRSVSSCRSRPPRRTPRRRRPRPKTGDPEPGAMSTFTDATKTVKTTTKQRVLVVEDDASIALGLRINLESEGYDVLSAEDGELGLAMVRGERPDLVILDVMLPKLNG